jgi:hypothetical protein
LPNVAPAVKVNPSPVTVSRVAQALASMPTAAVSSFERMTCPPPPMTKSAQPSNMHWLVIASVHAVSVIVTVGHAPAMVLTTLYVAPARQTLISCVPAAFLVNSGLRAREANAMAGSVLRVKLAIFTAAGSVPRNTRKISALAYIERGRTIPFVFAVVPPTVARLTVVIWGPSRRSPERPSQFVV